MSGEMLALVADIGGTNARFALTDLAAPAPELRAIRALPNAGFASLQQATARYLADTGVGPRHAAFAVASPVDTDEIQLTNRAWSFTRSQLQLDLGFDTLRVLNDFGAVAWGVPALQAGDRAAVHGAADAPVLGPVTVIGPGTGLGVALLVGSARTGWHVVETEGGHVSFAPLDEEEQRIARVLAALHGRVSTERVLCGDGLARVDAVVRGVADDSRPAALREPAEVVAAALAGEDPDAVRALERFCAILGSVAGDAALMHGARTVMIAGGVVPRFVPFLRRSAFRARFLAKGRFAAQLGAVAIHVITHPHPGLLGAAVALRAEAGALR